MDNWPNPLRDVVDIDLFDLGRMLGAENGIRWTPTVSRHMK
jgi:hypothetical protein